MSGADLQLLDNARIVTLQSTTGYGLIEHGALLVRGEHIVWVGHRDALPPDLVGDAQRIDCSGRLLTPALIDCHTHLVYAGDRANEFEWRLQGRSYAEIARSGGGILSSVRATRAASDETLLQAALQRLQQWLVDGVGTLEIKSGYGLDRDNELRMLRVARRLAECSGLQIRTTLLAAHALPPEYVDRADDYITLICEEILPAAVDQGLADAVDAFCEGIGFTLAQTRRVFETAQMLGLPVKLHAEQLSDLRGTRLVAEFGGLSADHIEYSRAEDLAALANAGGVGVLLPAAFLCLRETQLPDIASMRARGLPMAVATDHNPGTSPCLSLRYAMNLACTVFRLTPEEALRGVTVHAAKALGLTDRGQLLAGMRADLALWDLQHPAELSYWMAASPVHQLWAGGRRLR